MLIFFSFVINFLYILKRSKNSFLIKLTTNTSAHLMVNGKCRGHKTQNDAFLVLLQLVFRCTLKI